MKRSQSVEGDFGPLWTNFDARVLQISKAGGYRQRHLLTHTLAAFMIRLAHDLHIIMQEMYRTVQPGGLLGLATRGTPYLRLLGEAVGKGGLTD